VGGRKDVVLNVDKKLKLQKQKNQIYMGPRETNYIFQKLTTSEIYQNKPNILKKTYLKVINIKRVKG
jgi:hypothetical protein